MHDGARASRRASGVPTTRAHCVPPPTPALPHVQVPLDAFCALMEDAVAARPRPRAYLAPSPAAKPSPADTFAPAITERSKLLAAKLRPKVGGGARGAAFDSMAARCCEHVHAL